MKCAECKKKIDEEDEGYFVTPKDYDYRKICVRCLLDCVVAAKEWQADQRAKGMNLTYK